LRYLQGWALKGTKKATRFNENQRQYLDNKFQIGQESGHKADPGKVSRDMRYAMMDSLVTETVTHISAIDSQLCNR